MNLDEASAALESASRLTDRLDRKDEEMEELKDQCEQAPPDDPPELLVRVLPIKNVFLLCCLSRDRYITVDSRRSCLPTSLFAQGPYIYLFYLSPVH